MNQPTRKDPNRTLKIAMIVMLMIPAAVALGAGAMTVSEDISKGLPMIAGGVMIAAFNFGVLKFYFSKVNGSNSSK